jgi:hypothetical protein
VEKSMAIEKTAGFFAREVLQRFSELPIEDELHLYNTRIRDHFFKQAVRSVPLSPLTFHTY